MQKYVLFDKFYQNDVPGMNSCRGEKTQCSTFMVSVFASLRNARKDTGNPELNEHNQLSRNFRSRF